MTTPTGQLAIKDIAAVADVSRAAVSNWRARHDDFPQPTQDSPQRRPLFDLQEVITWLKKKDLLPEGADKKQAALALTAAANELRVADFDAISATTLMLYLLALRKQANSTKSDSTWQQVCTVTTTDNFIHALEQTPAPAGLDVATVLPWGQIEHKLRPSLTHSLELGAAVTSALLAAPTPCLRNYSARLRPPPLLQGRRFSTRPAASAELSST